jgi:hypothetical protein
MTDTLGHHQPNTSTDQHEYQYTTIHALRIVLRDQMLLQPHNDHMCVGINFPSKLVIRTV